jgi:hypothetical protein
MNGANSLGELNKKRVNRFGELNEKRNISSSCKIIDRLRNALGVC